MARIAIIGGGIAGLTAGYSLSPNNEVTLFEKSNRIGGNAFTLTTRSGDEFDIAVAAYGRAGYKNFYALLDELGVPTHRPRNAYMSFHDLDKNNGIYVSPNMQGLLAQHFDLLKPRRVVNAFLMFRGLSKAQALLTNGSFEGLTMSEALRLLPEISTDMRVVLLCSLCLLSSMSAEEVLSAPAEFFFNKLRVHNDVISPKALYSWRAVKGTKTYVNALSARFRTRVVLNSTIQKVRRLGDQILLLEEGEAPRAFDKVVFACPAPVALALLEAPTDDERRLLGAWRYKAGRMVVHRDHSAFPERSLIQAYTFLHSHRDGVLETSVNGAVWHLQHVRRDCDFISSQHPNFLIRDELIEFETRLHTPIFDAASIATIAQLPSLNGVNNSYFCGSHFGFGLHEDAVTSALQIAKQVNAERPAPHILTA